MLSPEKVATPATAATVLVPDKVPLLGFVPIATVMFPVNPLARSEERRVGKESRARVMAAPAVVVLGCTLNTNCVAPPAVILNAALVVLPASVVVRVSPVAILALLGLGSVASRATAATVLVPDKVPVLGLVPIATVMFPVNPLAVLPLASWAVIWTAGVIAAPATVLVGATLKTSAVAVPAVMLNAALVVLPAPVAVSV